MSASRPTSGSGSRGARLVVVGAGGNIGSHLVPLLGRMDEVGHLTLIDPDVYEPGNLASQDITGDDVGQPKVRVLARRLAAIAPELRVAAVAAAVEDVPWGLLRGDVILTGLDTRRARQAVNRRARWLGVPWLDAGVDAGGLARVTCYGPGDGQPCLECSWTDADYALLEQRYSCDGAPRALPASGAPARLGALAAAWQAIECHRLLASAPDDTHWGRQWIITTEGAEVFNTTLGRHPACRLPVHAPWRVEELDVLPAAITLREAFALAGADAAACRDLELEVPDLEFAAHTNCGDCGGGGPVLLSASHGGRDARRCASCGRELPAWAQGRRGALARADLADADLDRTLAELGLRADEIILLRGEGRERCFQLALAGTGQVDHAA